MRDINSIRHAVSVCVAVAVAGCSNGGSQLAPAVPMQQLSAAGFNAGQQHPIAIASVADGASRVSPDRIIYTPVNVQIENSSYDLVLDNGATDFVITESNWSTRSSCYHSEDLDYYGQLTVTNGQSGAGVLSSSGYAEALPSGAPIGPGFGESFVSGQVTMEAVSERWEQFWWGNTCHEFTSTQGNWVGVTAYVGLSFPIRGRTHYGWAQFTVNCTESSCPGLTATLTGFAYQTKAGESIKAGRM